MDARITKQRLGNLLSYDWLKMLIAIVIAVFLIILLFTMTATRVTNAQTFAVYAYTDLTAGKDFNSLGSTLKTNEVLSYDILETKTEKFSADDRYDIFSLRRTVGEGTVMFISDVRTYKTDDAGNPVYDEGGNQVVSSESALYSLAMGGAVNPDRPTSAAVYDTKYYLQMCEEYLISFFGENWRGNAEPDAAAVRESFLSRNSGDKRYKTAASREEGIVQERQRLIDLRDDYLTVLGLFENGTYTHTVYEGTDEEGKTYESALGINVGNLADISDVAYYTDSEGKAITEKLNLVILYNDFHEANGMLYEPITFLRWLYEEYGA